MGTKSERLLTLTYRMLLKIADIVTLKGTSTIVEN